MCICFLLLASSLHVCHRAELKESVVPAGVACAAARLASAQPSRWQRRKPWRSPLILPSRKHCTRVFVRLCTSACVCACVLVGSEGGLMRVESANDLCSTLFAEGGAGNQELASMQSVTGGSARSQPLCVAWCCLPVLGSIACPSSCSVVSLSSSSFRS